MKRVVIVGSSSCGKTTLANNISNKLGLEHKELDYFYWEPNWKEAALPVFRSRVEKFTSQDSWITDGNFASSAGDIVWSRATHIIWLDYSLPLIIKQFFIRSISRALKQEVLWTGCKETLWNSMFSPNSLLIWIIKNYKKNRVMFLKLAQSSDYPNASFLHFKRPAETEEFMKKL